MNSPGQHCLVSSVSSATQLLFRIVRKRDSITKAQGLTLKGYENMGPIISFKE